MGPFGRSLREFRNAHVTTLIMSVAAALLLPLATRGGGVVTNCNESALRAAMSGGGTVTFACDGPIALSKTLVITQDLVLDATGRSIVLSGGTTTRVFRVQTNITFTARNLAIADGSHVGANGSDGSPAQPGQDGRGAGLLNTGGQMTLIDCVLTNHSVQGGNAGYDATYAGNNAAGGRGIGAAICNLGGTVNLSNCIVSLNRAKGGRGSPDRGAVGVAGAGGEGCGAALFSAGGTVNLHRVTLASNQALGGDAQEIPPLNYGRAGDAFGGALYLTNSPLRLADSMVLSNGVTGAASLWTGPGCGKALGGGIYLAEGATGTVSRTTFAGNTAMGGSSGRFAPGGPGRGGAIFNAEQCWITEATFTGNQAVGGDSTAPGRAEGGGVCAKGRVAISGCTFNDNVAQGGSGTGVSVGGWPGAEGRGGAVWSTSDLTVINSTLSANRAAGGEGRLGPGGVGMGGGVQINGGRATLMNLTVAGNEAKGGHTAASIPAGASLGGGLGNTNGEVSLYRSIVANSVAGGDVWGTIGDSGYNLCSDNTGQFSAPGSLNNTDPVLGPLADNGGPTRTMALGFGSPAVDACGQGPETDQRGVHRPVGSTYDMGAFEGVQLMPPSVTTLGASNTGPTSATLNGSVNPNGSSTTAFFQWGTTTSYGNTTAPQNAGMGFDRVSVTAAIAGLSPALPYHFRIVASNAIGTSAGSDVVFVLPPVPPVVTNLAASSITSTSAVLNGVVNPMGSSTTARFYWYNYGLTTNGYTPWQAVGSGSSTQLVSEVLTGLQPDFSYRYWVEATNVAGSSMSLGSGQVFTTLPPPPLAPVVATRSVTNLTSTSATLTGLVNPGGAATAAAFEWGTSTNYGLRTSWQSVGSNRSDVLTTAILTSLPPGRVLYYRLTATNSVGAAVGKGKSFQTTPIPLVVTLLPDSPAGDSATLHGAVNPNGLSTTAYFQWGPTTNYANTTPLQTLAGGSLDQTISAVITGLTAQASYHCRVVALNSAGTAYGNDWIFVAGAGETITDCTEAWLRLALSTGGVVRFTCDGTIALSQTLTVGRDVVLDATGRDVTISGSNAVRLFIINPAVRLTLKGLTLADGLAQGTNGNVGQSGGSGDGGAIYNNGGVLQAEQCQFTGNRAQGGTGGDSPWYQASPWPGGGMGRGGAVFSAGGQVVLVDCRVLQNLAQGGRGGGCPTTPGFMI